MFRRLAEIIWTKNSIFALYLKKTKVMRVKLASIAASLVLLVGACSVPKDVAYFQGIDSLTQEQLSQMSQNYNTRICQDDMLNITVSAWDPTVVTPFNPPMFSYTQQGDEPVQASPSLYSYLVDKEGYITFPVLGRIHVAGMTKEELSSSLQEQISKYVKDPLVHVRITNFKVMVLGEVTRPGGLSVKNDRITVLEAIGYSGDVTINADRTNVLVVRDVNGQKEFGRLDLTGTDFFTSPYFYLQQNDVVYVEPNKAKKRNARYSQAQQYNVTIISTILTAVSVITSVIVAIAKK